MYIKLKKKVLFYIVFAIVCIIINVIYAQFSHEVSSNYMTYMFLYPLIVGIGTSILNYKNIKSVSDIFLCGILTLTIGSFLQGVFEIAGTSSDFQLLFYIIGVVFILIGLIYIAIKIIKDE